MSTDSLLKAMHDGDVVDEIAYSTSFPEPSDEVQDYLIFFMSGNPGLISFYEPFLSGLRDLLTAGRYQNARFHIYGHSYSGFETTSSSSGVGEPKGLQEQIEDQETRLMEYVKEHQVPGRELKVILMGHSVGSYILLELIQRHLRAVEVHPDMDDFDLIGGILLFPTIENIAQSPTGRIAKLVLPLPGFARIMGALASAISGLLSANALSKLVRLITKFPDYAVKTTVAFLQSPMGVRQALYEKNGLLRWVALANVLRYLANDEMKTIREDKWDSEVWQATRSPGTNKRDTINRNLVLFWGQQDQWVADHTRDNIIAARESKLEKGEKDWERKACTMEIDTRGLPHDFCTTMHNSQYIAGKVRGWIDGIIEKHSESV